MSLLKRTTTILITALFILMLVGTYKPANATKYDYVFSGSVTQFDGIPYPNSNYTDLVHAGDYVTGTISYEITSPLLETFPGANFFDLSGIFKYSFVINGAKTDIINNGWSRINNNGLWQASMFGGDTTPNYYMVDTTILKLFGIDCKFISDAEGIRLISMNIIENSSAYIDLMFYQGLPDQMSSYLGIAITSINSTPVPEPSTFLLLFSGFIFLGFYCQKRRSFNI